ncbi:MAG: GNAT family N-acetyltransferase [Deltaproteobacteria bacterium]|nr:GNAT family N-acetyltransferase [Deltaproteobacteria bacterium]MBW2724690.1 GNAT family N-acetyltransferase [Deltaproteobacteria bacterium]
MPKAGFLLSRDRDRVLAYLQRDPQLNLQLLDLIDRRPDSRSESDVEPVVLVAWDGDEVTGVAALRPSLLFDAHLTPTSLEAFLPFFNAIETGLLKSLDSVVTDLWNLLRGTGRRTLIDRYETAFAIRAGELSPAPLPEGAVLRHAVVGDLDQLVYAARASLREEQRPDPADRDPVGFERWVRGRLGRARVVEVRGELVFVSYADVRRAEGWLVQGVFTWPAMRRRGFAAAAMSGLVSEALESGAEHIQLAVIEGNEAALNLYDRLGFRSFARLRTVLFTGAAGATGVAGARRTRIGGPR